MFVNYGIKRKDLESDLDFAFSLFKKVIVGLGSENKLKNSSLDKIEHTFLPPAEREKARRQEEPALAKLNSKRTIKKNLPQKKSQRILLQEKEVQFHWLLLHRHHLRRRRVPFQMSQMQQLLPHQKGVHCLKLIELLN